MSHSTSGQLLSRRGFLTRLAASGAALLLLLLAGAGCSYIFSEKRTVYQFDPPYGVDSPEFRRSLEALGTEMVAGNQAVLLENGDRIFPAMLSAIVEACSFADRSEYCCFSRSKSRWTVASCCSTIGAASTRAW